MAVNHAGAPPGPGGGGGLCIRRSLRPLLAVLLVSAFGQLYRPAAQSLITELTPPARLVMVTAMYRLSLNLGTTAAPLIGVALVSVSYNLLFWGEALAAVSYGGRGRRAGTHQRSPPRRR